MQRDGIFRTRLAIAIAAFGNFTACNGYLGSDSPSGSRPGAEDQRASQTEAGGGTPLGGAGLANPGAQPLAGTSSTWSVAVGTWCGPAEQQTLWLAAQPGTDSCQVASRRLYNPTGEDSSPGLALELDTPSLASLPATLQVPARYCSPSSACADVSATLHIDSYTPGQGLHGTWAFTPPNESQLAGSLDATWCNWDELLPAHPAAERLARDIEISEVAVYQGVKVPLVRGLEPVNPRNADLVQNREALLRVFVQPRPGFQSRTLSARVTLQDTDAPPRYFEQTLSVSGPSSELEGASTFNLELPKDAFQAGTQYAVELRETARCTALAGTAVGARFPEAGLAPVGARATGPVKVMLVPVRYEADGSGRLPDTSPEQLASMSQRLYSMFPTSEVVLSVRDAVATDRTLLGDMLDQLRELRTADAPPSDLAYYGMVRQADSFSEYCQGACTTGLAGFGSQTGTAASGMGVAFPETTTSTFVHELGHIYRRPHAPCGGASSPDEAYPYAGAKLGSWGYDFQTHELFEPTTHVDFMSYCSPEWISDYSYQQILERIIVVNQHAAFRRLAGPSEASAYRTLRVTADGQASWGLELRPRFGPPGDPTTLQALDMQGNLLEEVPAFFEDGPDGERAFFVPAGRVGWHAIHVPGGPTLPYAGQSSNTPFAR